MRCCRWISLHVCWPGSFLNSIYFILVLFLLVVKLVSVLTLYLWIYFIILIVKYTWMMWCAYPCQHIQRYKHPKSHQVDSFYFVNLSILFKNILGIWHYVITPSWPLLCQWAVTKDCLYNWQSQSVLTVWFWVCFSPPQVLISVWYIKIMRHSWFCV